MDPKPFLKNLYELAKNIALVLILSFLIRTIIVQTFVVQGKSMEPNYFNRDYLLVEKISYRLAPPRRGQIVVFRNPENRRVDFVKRLIGLPEERVEFSGGNLKINGEPVDEPYLANLNQASEPDFEIELGQNQYFVLGDNRANSLDSRRIGPISKQDLIGRVFVRVLPLTRFGLAAAPNYAGF